MKEFCCFIIVIELTGSTPVARCILVATSSSYRLKQSKKFCVTCKRTKQFHTPFDNQLELIFRLFIPAQKANGTTYEFANYENPVLFGKIRKFLFSDVR